MSRMSELDERCRYTWEHLLEGRPREARYAVWWVREVDPEHRADDAPLFMGAFRSVLAADRYIRWLKKEHPPRVYIMWRVPQSEQG